MAEISKKTFKSVSNKDLISDINLVKNNSSYSKSYKKELADELERRKQAGTIRSDAGEKKNTNNGIFGGGDIDFNKPIKFKKFF